LWINPIMSMYFAFDLTAVAQGVHYLPRLKDTQSMFEVTAVIDGYQRQHHTLKPWTAIPV
jgi:hypothetical protein